MSNAGTPRSVSVVCCVASVGVVKLVLTAAFDPRGRVSPCIQELESMNNSRGVPTYACRRNLKIRGVSGK